MASSCAKSGTRILSLLGLMFLVLYGIWTLHPQLAARSIGPNNPLQRATGKQSAGMPGNQRRRSTRERVGLPPAYGSTAGGRRGPRAVSCSLIDYKRIVLLTRGVDLFLRRPVKFFQNSNLSRSPELKRKRFLQWGRDPLTSSRGCLRPSCARPLGGPRISSAARHRLVRLLA